MKILRELYDGNYYGYQIGPNRYRRQMHRIASAIEELQRVFREREADESPQSKYAEAKLSARHILGIDQNAELGNFPRLHDVADLNGVAKGESSTRIGKYMSEDVGLKPPEHEADTRPEFLDMVLMLARDQAKPSEVPNPPARVITALVRKADRRRMAEDARWMELTPQSALVKHPSGEINTRIDIERGLSELGLSSDQIQVLRAKFDGLSLQSPETAEILGWTPDRLERTRRLLCPDQKPGKALRRYFAAYKSHH
jgi:hypothetical protein